MFLIITKSEIQNFRSEIIEIQIVYMKILQCIAVNAIFWKNLNEPPHDKTNKMTVCQAKTRISLGIRPVWSESSLCAQLVAKDPGFLHVDSEDSDQTGRMPRLIWVFAGCIVILLVLSWGGSCISAIKTTQHTSEIYASLNCKQFLTPSEREFKYLNSMLIIQAKCI